MRPVSVCNRRRIIINNNSPAEGNAETINVCLLMWSRQTPYTLKNMNSPTVVILKFLY